MAVWQQGVLRISAANHALFCMRYLHRHTHIHTYIYIYISLQAKWHRSMRLSCKDLSSSSGRSTRVFATICTFAHLIALPALLSLPSTSGVCGDDLGVCRACLCAIWVKYIDLVPPPRTSKTGRTQATWGCTVPAYVLHRLSVKYIDLVLEDVPR